MKYTTIPNTDLEVSVLTLGTWVFGGDVWSGARDDESLGAVRAAIDQGINMIDTAPIYGAGRSETIVGKALKGMREKAVVVTKCGLHKRGDKITINLQPQAVRREVEESLRRLDTEYIDIYLCHWPDADTPLEETLECMVRLREQGKIRHIGLSNYSRQDLDKARVITDIAMLQAQYSLLERSIETELLPYCQQNGVGTMMYGVLGGGILSGKYLQPKDFDRSDARNFFYKFYEGRSFEKTQKLMAALKAIDRPLNQTAINWVRQQPGVTTAIIGCRNAEQVRANAGAADWELTPDQIDLINGVNVV